MTASGLTILARLGKNNPVQKAVIHTERMINRNNANSSMSPGKTIGVLTERELQLVETVGGKRVLRSLLLPTGTSDLSELVEFLWRAELREVWMLPATPLSQNVTCTWFEQAHLHWTIVVHPAPHHPTRPICVLLWPREGSLRAGRQLALVFPEYAGWDWALSDAKSLLATVTYLDQVVGRPLFDTPEIVAHQLLNEQTLDQATMSLRSSSLDLYRLPASDGMPLPMLERARDLVWRRPLTLQEQRERYLHKYSHLSLALEAARSVALGTGEPQHSPTGRAFDGRRPGLWRVEAEPAGSLFDGKRLPSCLEGEWMSTPQVQCCRTIGYRVHIGEGYAWPEAYPVLQRWATTLWQAAERLHTGTQLFRHAQARANASCTITRLVELGVATLAVEQAAGGWGRPDWWACLVGGSRASLFTHLVRLVRKGTMPVLVAGDALWVVSNDPDPLTAVPGLVTARPWQGYTISYMDPLPLSGEVQAAFRATEDASHLARRLDALARDVFP